MECGLGSFGKDLLLSLFAIVFGSREATRLCSGGFAGTFDSLSDLFFLKDNRRQCRRIIKDISQEKEFQRESVSLLQFIPYEWNQLDQPAGVSHQAEMSWAQIALQLLVLVV
mmetsp:Transcript_23845/g.35589  ORF Transcript_23845/g.35589 Transcript_23845/m.35589 type:complete len:112 (+) Transcript_23845:354-689(+)